MAPGACKIRRGCNVLRTPMQIIRLGGVPKRGGASCPWRSKIMMACLWIILNDESQIVSNSQMRSFSPTLNPTNQHSNVCQCFLMPTLRRNLRKPTFIYAYIHMYIYNLAYERIFKFYISRCF